MKRRQILATGLSMLLPNLALASLGGRSPERDVSGKVVDTDKRRGIVVLADYKGWDREQMNQARVVSKSATQRWLDGIDPKHAAIFLKPEDVAKLKKGERIQIAKYSYAFAGYRNGRGANVVPLYNKLEVTPK